jgi:parallel beta-helix repeat protein
MTQNQYNFGVSGSSLQEFIHDIDVSNHVDGKPVVYCVNESNKQAPADAGYVAFINSKNVTVENLNLTNNWQSVLLAYTTDSQVRASTLSSNMDALWLIDCSNCSVYENSVQNNDWGGIAVVDSSFCVIQGNNISGNKGYGVFLSDSSDNQLYHNSFNNTNQVWLFGVNSNTWDLGAQIGGNYWSNYDGGDANVDGIGDKPYVIASGNEDFFPLMEPYVSSEESSTIDFVMFVIVGIVILVAAAIVFLFVLKNRRGRKR